VLRKGRASVNRILGLDDGQIALRIRESKALPKRH